MSIYVKCNDTACKHYNGCTHSRVHKYIEPCTVGCREEHKCKPATEVVVAAARITNTLQVWKTGAAVEVDYD